MRPNEFLRLQDSKSDKDYGLCTPPTDAQEGLDILIEHFLGDDWYVTMPMSQTQVNTEAIYEILEQEKCKCGFWCKLSKLFK